MFQMNEIGGMVPLIVAKLDTYSSTVYLSGVRQAPFGKRFGSLLQTTSHDDYEDIENILNATMSHCGNM